MLVITGVANKEEFQHNLGWKQKVCVMVNTGDAAKYVTTRLCVTGEELAALKEKK